MKESVNIIFSIIMPVFNREAVVKTAIESVLSQDYPFFELICIDDGSSDRTSCILQEYAVKDKRIVFLQHVVNKGRSAARNTGIRAAKGQWLCFLDSDDVYFPTHLSSHANLIATEPLFGSFATGQLIYNKPKKYPFRIKKQGTEVTLSHLITENFIQLNQVSIRRDITPFFLPETISYAEDLLFIRRILERSRLLLTSSITSNILQSGTRSVITEKRNKVAMDNWAAAKSFCETTHAGNMNKRILAYTTLFCTSLLQSGGEFRESFLYFKRAFSYPEIWIIPLFYKVLLKYIILPFLKR